MQKAVKWLQREAEYSKNCQIADLISTLNDISVVF